jgi:hypothetical protein
VTLWPRERPTRRRVNPSWLVTGNAASNDAMLSINRQLGYRASAAVKIWQVSTERARACQSGS